MYALGWLTWTSPDQHKGRELYKKCTLVLILSVPPLTWTVGQVRRMGQAREASVSGYVR